MSFHDPSEESLPGDHRRGPVDPEISVSPGSVTLQGGARISSLGNRSGLGPMAQVAPTPPMLRMGPPFSERFDRSIDEIVSPLGSGGGGSTDEIDHPFKIVDSSDGTPKVTVHYGTMMDVQPTNVGSVRTLTANVTNYLYLENGVNTAGIFQTSELIVSTSAQPADDDNTAYITLGIVVAAGTGLLSIGQAVTHSLRMATCGRILNEDGSVIIEPGQYEFWGV